MLCKKNKWRGSDQEFSLCGSVKENIPFLQNIKRKCTMMMQLLQYNQNWLFQNKLVKIKQF